jgi:intein-encoded DNA endonuclease-like protein
MTEKQICKQQQMIAAANEFIKGAKPQEVMKKYNICYASIWNTIKRYNLPYKKTWGREIFFDIDFFEKIDTEAKAYWLGFIFADGSVVKTDKNLQEYNRVCVSISAKDIAHLQKLESILNFSKPNRIKIYKKTPNASFKSEYDTCYLHLNSIKLCSDIINHGCVPQKTYDTTHNPQNIPDHLICHFIRGYFDGDGSISGKLKSPMFSITTSKNHNEWIQSYLMRFCNLNKTKLTFCRNAYQLDYGGINQIVRIFHYLYDDATIYLERKYNKFYSYVSNREQTISSSLSEKDKELGTSA